VVRRVLGILTSTWTQPLDSLSSRVLVIHSRNYEKQTWFCSRDSLTPVGLKEELQAEADRLSSMPKRKPRTVNVAARRRKRRRQASVTVRQRRAKRVKQNHARRRRAKVQNDGRGKKRKAADRRRGGPWNAFLREKYQNGSIPFGGEAVRQLREEHR